MAHCVTDPGLSRAHTSLMVTLRASSSIIANPLMKPVRPELTAFWSQPSGHVLVCYGDLPGYYLGLGCDSARQGPRARTPTHPYVQPWVPWVICAAVHGALGCGSVRYRVIAINAEPQPFCVHPHRPPTAAPLSSSPPLASPAPPYRPSHRPSCRPSQDVQPRPAPPPQRAAGGRGRPARPRREPRGAQQARPHAVSHRAPCSES